MKDIRQRTKSWWKQNTANVITVTGLIVSSWLLVEIIFNPQNLTKIFFLYLLSGASDFFDGKVARRLNIESPFGSIADQFRDKVLFCPSQIILVFQYHNRFHPFLFALIFVFAALELLTFFGGVVGIFWNIKGTKNINIESSNWGRKKTFAGFIVSLLIIFYIYPFNPATRIIKNLALAIAYFGLILMIYWSLKNLAEYKGRAWPNNKKAQ